MTEPQLDQTELHLDNLRISLAADGVAAGIVVARGCTTTAESAALDEAMARALDNAKRRTEETTITQPVRNVLRHGVYKPTGRGKPASEYLLKAARNDSFPRINNLVDLNNLISLESLLPISLIDLGRAQTDTFTIRRGRPDEAYVFNTTGQTIALHDLLLVARGPEDEPCANPVKDSMATKLDAAARDVMAVLYAPPDLQPNLETATQRFADGFVAFGQAQSVDHGVLVRRGDH